MQFSYFNFSYSDATDIVWNAKCLLYNGSSCSYSYYDNHICQIEKDGDKEKCWR
jgi:hypothetical protein